MQKIGNLDEFRAWCNTDKPYHKSHQQYKLLLHNRENLPKVVNIDQGLMHYKITDYSNLYYYARDFIENDANEYVVSPRGVGSSKLMIHYAMYNALENNLTTVISLHNSASAKEIYYQINNLYDTKKLIDTVKIELIGNMIVITPILYRRGTNQKYIKNNIDFYVIDCYNYTPRKVLERNQLLLAGYYKFDKDMVTRKVISYETPSNHRYMECKLEPSSKF